MQPGQKIAFTIAALSGTTICAALALGKLSPPPEPIYTTPQTITTPTFASTTNTLIITSTSTRPIRIHATTTFEDSLLEQADIRPANYSTELLDTTSPLPEITFE